MVILKCKLSNLFTRNHIFYYRHGCHHSGFLATRILATCDARFIRFILRPLRLQHSKYKYHSIAFMRVLFGNFFFFLNALLCCQNICLIETLYHENWLQIKRKYLTQPLPHLYLGFLSWTLEKGYHIAMPESGRQIVVTNKQLRSFLPNISSLTIHRLVLYNFIKIKNVIPFQKTTCSWKTFAITLSMKINPSYKYFVWWRFRQLKDKNTQTQAKQNIVQAKHYSRKYFTKIKVLAVLIVTNSMSLSFSFITFQIYLFGCFNSTTVLLPEDCDLFITSKCKNVLFNYYVHL